MYEILNNDGVIGQAIVTLIIYGLFMLLTQPITDYDAKEKRIDINK